MNCEENPLHSAKFPASTTAHAGVQRSGPAFGFPSSSRWRIHCSFLITTRPCKDCVSLCTVLLHTSIISVHDWLRRNKSAQFFSRSLLVTLGMMQTLGDCFGDLLGTENYWPPVLSCAFFENKRCWRAEDARLGREPGLRCEKYDAGFCSRRIIFY